MDEGTTTATLSTPAFDYIIERPRLIALLEEGDARVSLLAAPAGYGKTTLARQWSARQTGPVAWYRATRTSGDVAALAVHLDELLNKTVPQPKRNARRVAAIAAANANPQPLARALVSMYAGLRRDFLLVVDGWEAADTEEAEQLMALLVDELDIRFLITSRTRPPWFTPRLTIYGEGLEIGMEALTMTDQEALSVLSTDHAPEDPESLLNTARGWPAVLGLAAMQAVNEFLPTSMEARTLYDYLATELLDSATQAIRHGVTLLAVASASEASAAKLLVGEGHISLLNGSSRCGLLRLETDGTFSIHPLVRDILVDKLRQLSEDEFAEAIRSLDSLIGSARWDEALAAAEATQDHGFTSRAFEAALPDLIRSGRSATLRRWVAACRAARVDSGLVGYVEAEIALREGAFDRAIVLGEMSARRLDGDLAAKAHLLTARAANLADRLDRARKHLAAATALATTPETRAAALWATFVHTIDEEAPGAEQLLEDFTAIASGPEQVVRSAHGRISLALLDGGLKQTLEDSEVARTLGVPDLDPMIVTSFLNISSGAASVLADYSSAMALATQETAIADEFDLEFVHRHAIANMARAASGLRQVALASRALAELGRKLKVERDVFLEANRLIVKARCFLTTGEMDRAIGLLAAEPAARLNRATRGEYLALRAVILAASGVPEEAREAGERALEECRAVEVQCLVEVARSISSLSTRKPKAAATLLTGIREAGGWDALVMGCRASLPLAQHLAVDSEHRGTLLAVFRNSNDTPLARRLGLEIPRSGERAGTLSPREHEIHGLIAQAMTNREISKLLYISESTTKVHVRHILEKLGVRSRVEAARVWEPPAEQ